MVGHDWNNESSLVILNHDLLGEKQITLMGDPSLIRAECSLETIKKTWEKEDQWFLLEI